MTCDVCNNWEHVGCVRHSDKLSNELYEALKTCRSRAILYVCTRCRGRGSIIKRLHECEVDSARAQEQRLASVQRIDELSERIREFRKEKQSLLNKQAALEEQLQALNQLRIQEVTRGTTTPVGLKVEKGADSEVQLPQSKVATEQSHCSGSESSEESSSSNHRSGSSRSRQHDPEDKQRIPIHQDLDH